MKYGVSRNGEHVELCENQADAEAAVVRRKAEDQQMAQAGWITQADADTARYRVSKVRRGPW